MFQRYADTIWMAEAGAMSREMERAPPCANAINSVVPPPSGEPGEHHRNGDHKWSCANSKIV